MKTIIVNKEFLINNQPYTDRLFIELCHFFIDLNDEYPNFKIWIRNSFEDIYLEKRSIIVNIYKDEIISASILKHTKEQNKICTFRVTDKFKRLGLGSKLMKESINLLEIDKPLITVSQKRIEEFKPFLEKFKFKLYTSLDSYYKENTFEYVFNEDLDNNVLELV